MESPYWVREQPSMEISRKNILADLIVAEVASISTWHVFFIFDDMSWSFLRFSTLNLLNIASLTLEMFSIMFIVGMLPQNVKLFEFHTHTHTHTRTEIDTDTHRHTRTNTHKEIFKTKQMCSRCNCSTTSLESFVPVPIERSGVFSGCPCL